MAGSHLPGAVDMPVPISEDEADSPRSKRCPQRESSPLASKRRQGAMEEGVTLAGLEKLFQKHTRELRDAQKLELARATGQMQLEVRKNVDGPKDELRAVTAHMAGLETRLDDLELKNSELEKKLEAVAKAQAVRPVDAQGSGRDESRLGLVMGGWPATTRREDLLKLAKGITDELDIASEMDGNWYSTGLRRGFVLSEGFGNMRASKMPE